MGARKVARIVHTVVGITSSDNPAEKAGKVVAAAVTAAHPVVGRVLRKPIRKATEAVVNKGIEIAKKPEVQAAVKNTVSTAGRHARSLMDQGVRKAKAFREGKNG